eukprot:330813_1
MSVNTENICNKSIIWITIIALLCAIMMIGLKHDMTKISVILTETKIEFGPILKDVGKKTQHFRIKQNKKYGYYMHWCMSFFPDTGLGNRLGAYWLGRSLAFWWNIPFVLNEKCTCTKYDFYLCRKYDIHNQWTQFLPHYSNISFYTLFQSETHTFDAVTYSLWHDILNEMNIDNINISQHTFNNKLDIINITTLKNDVYKQNKTTKIFFYKYFGMYLFKLYNNSASY